MKTSEYERRLHGETDWNPVSESFVHATLTAAHRIKDVNQKFKTMDDGGVVTTPIAEYRRRYPENTRESNI